MAAGDSTEDALSTEEIHSALQNYIVRGFCSGVLRCFRSHVNEVRMAIRDFGITLMRVTANIPMSDQVTAIDQDCHSLVDDFNQQLLKDGSIQLRDLLQKAQSTTAVPAILQKQALLFLTKTEDIAEKNETETSSQSVKDQAQPVLSNVGGGRNVLAVLPQYLPATDWQERLQSRFGICVTLDDQQEDADLFVCCEVEDVRLDLVVEQLSEGDRTVTEMTSQAHSRIDIDW
jgi:hypothetical protein